MWIVWVSAVHLHFIRIHAQFNFQAWQYRPPNQQQITENPIFFPYHQRFHPRISMPVSGLNPNLYPRSFPISAQSSLSLGASTVPKTSLQNIPFQSTWMTSSSPLLTDQKDDVGYVAEINKSVGVMNFISTTPKNDYNKYIDVKPYLPDFLRGTSDEVQKNFYNIVSNQDESFRQKQNKLDQLVLSLDSKNQELYDHFRRMKELEEREKRERVHAIVATMSNKAQAVFAKLSAVLMNPEMKDMDRMNKINDFYKSVDEDVKNEFKDRIHGLNWQL